MKNKVVAFVLFAMGIVPAVLFAAEKTNSKKIQPPVLKLMSSPATLPDSVIAIAPATPRGPNDLIQGYEAEMDAVSNRLASELSSIAQAAERNQINSDQAEQVSRQRYGVAMMQFQLLVALRANLEREIDRAKQMPERISNSLRDDVSAVVELPFSSLQLSPELAHYLRLTPNQAAAIQEVMANERGSLEPMMAVLRITGQKLYQANLRGHSDREVRALAISQANIISNLIVADSRLQSRIYETLDDEQRKKLDHLRQGDAIAVLNEQ
jgi:DNA-binding MarR family transcriptional regulator